MSKLFGFLLGIVVALAGPAGFGVLTADGGIELSAKEMALAYGIGALVFWFVVSLFSGAAALGAALAFGGLIYAVHWIPNRLTNFLNDLPGVTAGMIDGLKQYTLNGLVPVLAVISLIFAVQLIVRSVQRRRRQRIEADRLQRLQELEEAEANAPYQPGDDYPPQAGDPDDGRYDDPYAGNRPQFPASYAADRSTPTKAGSDKTAPLPADDEGDTRPAPDDDRTARFEAGPPADDEHPEQTGRYRERMDGPEPEDNRPQAPLIMELPGRFRPA